MRFNPQGCFVEDFKLKTSRINVAWLQRETKMEEYLPWMSACLKCLRMGHVSLQILTFGISALDM